MFDFGGSLGPEPPHVLRRHLGDAPELPHVRRVDVEELCRHAARVRHPLRLCARCANCFRPGKGRSSRDGTIGADRWLSLDRKRGAPCAPTAARGAVAGGSWAYERRGRPKAGCGFRARAPAGRDPCASEGPSAYCGGLKVLGPHQSYAAHLTNVLVVPVVSVVLDAQVCGGLGREAPGLSAVEQHRTDAATGPPPDKNK